MPELLEPVILSQGTPGRRGVTIPEAAVPGRNLAEMLPSAMLRKEPAALPEKSELEVVRHYLRLSQLNHAIDKGFYPLGSCTMKYNPKVNEWAARLDGLANLHPYQPVEQLQGALEIMHDLQEWLCTITGLERCSLQPAAGAHGELTGILMIKAYHQHRGDTKRTRVLVPDSAHGTNPATAAVAGFEVVTVSSDSRGLVDLADLKSKLDDRVAALMLTNPNTLGLFEEDILEIQEAVHAAGGLLYYDGANFNAILGTVRPGDMGFDVVHLNLHKTFSTPHGGGGPGSGPVVVGKALAPFLPVPTVVRDAAGRYSFESDRPLTIGRVKAFFGNFGMHVRAYAYILAHGAEGLAQVSRDAVLNANYLKARLKDDFEMPHPQPCMHEFVMSGSRQKSQGCNTLVMGKRLIDFGIHPPTIYFPLIVPEAMMIEPTETESKETLDTFVKAMKTIAREVEEDPAKVQQAPHTTPVARVDEVKAARQPVLRWKA
ncbi:MAG: aminomethyl-transferring glycine dehydrogenase subunit GcvPB [Candidatus Sericytochromatia bacterium]|nr:aminomethyl-transferring glycine dehydrogenase subunit GcvPB [Candidatus Sericytochromatia bacterium]